MRTIDTITHEFPGYAFVWLTSGEAFTVGDCGLQGYTSERRYSEGYGPDLDVVACRLGEKFPSDGWDLVEVTHDGDVDVVRFANGWLLECSEFAVTLVRFDDGERVPVETFTTP